MLIEKTHMEEDLLMAVSIDTDFWWQKEPRKAIDTNLVAIRATKQLLTPTSVPAFLPTGQLQAKSVTYTKLVADKPFRLLTLKIFSVLVTKNTGLV